MKINIGDVFKGRYDHYQYKVVKKFDVKIGNAYLIEEVMSKKVYQTNSLDNEGIYMRIKEARTKSAYPEWF